MSLHLDARQRAMLQEMGVTVWSPAEATPPPSPVRAGASAAHLSAGSATTPVPVVATPRAAARTMEAPKRTPLTPPATAVQAVDGDRTSALTPATASLAVLPALKLHAARSLYPQADPAQTPAQLGGAWLVVAESATPDDPLAGDVGRLLDNMLRAMQLHRHPRVYLASLERTEAGASRDADIPSALAEMADALQPAMVLLLGHLPARAALGLTEPLGRLRMAPHTLAQCPAVVTYDPAYLLRSPQAKAAAWVDVCRALATVRRASPSA